MLLAQMALKHPELVAAMLAKEGVVPPDAAQSGGQNMDGMGGGGAGGGSMGGMGSMMGMLGGGGGGQDKKPELPTLPSAPNVPLGQQSSPMLQAILQALMQGQKPAAAPTSNLGALINGG